MRVFNFATKKKANKLYDIPLSFAIKIKILASFYPNQISVFHFFFFLTKAIILIPFLKPDSILYPFH